MMGMNNILPSKGPWALLVVLVEKKDSTHCFRVDYHQVNSVTRKDAFSLSRVDDALDIIIGKLTIV